MLDRSFHNPAAIQAFVALAIKEDIGAGDVTTMSSIGNNQIGIAHCLVKEPCTLAGVALAIEICKYVDATMNVTFTYKDGALIENTPLCVGVIEGKLSSILKAERVLLNCMQRMSGIATQTKKFVDLAKNTGTAIYDTRKTTPNFRLPEKWAVAIGGGVNHRFGLDDQILIKDNHIKAAGGIRAALDKCLDYCSQQNIKIPVIVEVQQEAEFNIALAHKVVDRILVDNHDPKKIENYIMQRDAIAPNIKIEISGGITLENIGSYCIQGVDCISVGALTHHVASTDISLKVQ